ncbi:Ig-like domain-containing protein [Streptomyces sp. NPDC005373]|uniref:L,D-transpeptidase n=1 Tax=Streptomyces sp. NPDC005373 TaxID=3156879 RepID=UPI0033A0C73B
MPRVKPPTALAALLVPVFCLAGCGAEANTAENTPSGATSAGAKTAATHRIRLNVTDGQTHASLERSGRVAVTGGKLTGVSLASGGSQVRGGMSTDRRSWAPTTPLSYGTTYTLAVGVTDDEGHKRTKRVTFTTLRKSERFVGTFLPEDGSIVGVGMPVSLTFDKAITNKKAVESAIKINSTSGQQVVGHWVSAQRIDFRPKDYWKACSTVTVRLELDGVKGADSAYGEQNKTIRFAVGRSQVSTVDASSHQMRIIRDGKLIKTVPITAGAATSTTYNGQMVISEKLIQTRMNGATVGFAGQYDIPDVPHAMRLSTSGTFIHGNYWAADSVFGHSNVSHGCVGLNDVKGGGDQGQDAAWFYSNSLVGDVIVVKNSTDKTIAPDNGLNGWNMPWQEWQSGSAL